MYLGLYFLRFIRLLSMLKSLFIHMPEIRRCGWGNGIWDIGYRIVERVLGMGGDEILFHLFENDKCMKGYEYFWRNIVYIVELVFV